MTPETAKTYCDHISFCELIAQNYNLSSQRLYTSDYGEAKATADALLQSKEFGVFNERLNRKPRTALAWLLMFINTGGKSDSVNFTRDVIPENRKKEPVQNYASPTPKSFGTGIHKSFEDTRRKEREAEREKRDAAAKAAAERCEKVLREHFRKGFRINSNIDIKRFRKFYSDMYGEEPKVSNDEIKSIIRRVTVPYDDLYYLPEAMLGEDVREKLLAYIENCFNSGKTIVYFQALCRKFEEDFLDYRVYNDPNALKTYLMLTGCKGFYIVNSGVAKNPNAVADPADELRSCLAEFGRPASFDEIFESLPHLSHDRIRNLIYSRGEFIHNGSSLYLHESLADITEDELEDIAKIIEDAIAEREFISGTELYQAVKAKYPDITENNSVFSIHGFRDMLKYKFGDRFSFKANIISKAGEEISRYDVFADYAKSHAGFTLAELEVMADELDMSIHLDAVYDNSLRISRDNFVAKSQAQFDVEATDNALDRMCVGDYIATGRVTNFGIFPYAGFPWNSFLLEHYVYSYSKKYMLVKNGFSKNRCASAIVKRSAGIESFDDFLVRLLADSDVELKNEPVLRFIVNEGYLTKRSYANIDNIIAKAKTQRQKRDGD
ncbi:MAG: hypothetical protein LUH40_04935 [Clostridiales bacterium]|nr:hypothetical protein [Clostridiales bacterium]